MGHQGPILEVPWIAMVSGEKVELRSLTQTPEAMFLDHALNGLPIHAGLSCRTAHMTVIALQEVCQKLALERADDGLFGVFEACGVGIVGDTPVQLVREMIRPDRFS